MIADYLDRLRESVLMRNAAWLFAGQGFSLILQAAYFVVLARLLGTAQYGLLAGAIALVSIVSQYSTLGSGLLFLRYVSPDHSRFPIYWGNILLSITTMGSLLVLGLGLFGKFFIGKESVPILLPIAVSDCLFQQLSSCAGQVFQAFEKMKVSATVSLVSSVLRLLLAVAMLHSLGRASAWQWAIASLCITFTAALIVFVAVTRSFGLPSFSPTLLVKRAVEGFVFAISGSTTAVYNDIDKVVLSHYGMNVANGIYSMAYRIVNIGTMPVMSIVSAAFPSFFRAGAKGISATLPMATLLLKRTALLGIVITCGLFLSAPLIPHFVGHSYVESVRALRWLCLIPFFRCFHLSAGDAIAGAGYQRYRLVSQSIAAGGNLLLNLYLIPKYSWWGAAWASLITDGGLSFMNWGALYLLARPGRQTGSMS